MPPSFIILTDELPDFNSLNQQLTLFATYTYDTAVNGLGQLASSTWRRTSSTFDSESFTYDYRGRLKTHIRNIDGRNYSQTVQ